VLSLSIQNESLLLKNLHKIFNKLDLPWVHLLRNFHYPINGRLPVNNRKVSFWWKDVSKLLTSYKGMATVIVNDGSFCLFLA